MSKVQENRMRRLAERRGLRLEKSRVRDPEALGYGGYRLLNLENNRFEIGSSGPRGYSADLDQIEGFFYHRSPDGRPSLPTKKRQK